MNFLSEQLRAARAILRWSQEDLAEQSGVSLGAIKRLEAAPGPLAAQTRIVAKFVEALEKAGIELIGPDRTGRVGVILNTKTKSDDHDV
jgi:transcriptional regulator with XRE-family HTH domain